MNHSASRVERGVSTPGEWAWRSFRRLPMDISRHFFVGWLLSSLACGGQGPSAQQSPQALRAAGTDARPFNATFSYPAGATRVTCLDPPACTRILFEAETSGYAQGLG